MRIVLQGAFGALVAAVLLYWVFHAIDPKTLREDLRHASWTMLALGAAVNLGHNVFRVWRWRWLLDPVRPAVPFRPMAVAVILGYFTTWLVPGRIGEVVRPALLSAKEDLPLGPCVGTVVADRLLDGVTIVALFAVGTLGASFAPSAAAVAAEIRTSAWLFLLVMIAGLLALVAMSTGAARVEVWLAGRPPVVRWVGHAMVGLSRGAAALRSPKRFVLIVAYSLASWVTIGVGTWLGVRGAGVDIGLAESFVMLPLLALGVAIPTPGGAGGYHFAMQSGLTALFGVDPTAAAAAGLLMHLAILLPILALGPILLATEKISWRDMVAAAKHVKAMGHGTPR
jgi:uncharacterized protein (TIRG00374 family)